MDNAADAVARTFIESRTLFSRVPTDLYAARAAIAAQLTGPSDGKSASRATVMVNETFEYILHYTAGDVAHTLTITDVVPVSTTVSGVTGSKSPSPTFSGQTVGWTVAVAAQETVTLTIMVQAAQVRHVTNTATFSGTETLQASAPVLVYGTRVYLPLVMRLR
ncbi:MAG: hypothetical protein JXA21_12915 [Anaerolineae bacterium]|nr:hypothetical protein [Anaerolineae bacterium]